MEIRQLYPAAEGPRYIKGHAISLAMGAFAVVGFGTVWVYYIYINGRRASGKEDEKTAGMSEAELEELGDKSPRFIFVT